MKAQLYKIETLTNLHVGSGDINFGVVDNQVQKDPITNLPNINSSSLKGAFREHFAQKDNAKALVEYIFGPDNSSNDSHQTGAYSFMEAELLTRPVRSNEKAYFNATAPMVIKSLLEKIETFNIDFDSEIKKSLEELANLTPEIGEPLIFENLNNTILEDLQAKYQNFDTSKLQEFLGEDLALFSDEDFKNLDLPVIARNQLDNGESKNLWYEEIVPKKSTFTFVLLKPTNISEADAKKINGLENRFDNESMQLQIGANKSIGYGFCNIKRVSK
jgi:CRISPR-associated protein Cmr4